MDLPMPLNSAVAAVCSRPPSLALLLSRDGDTPEDANIARMVDFFGLSWKVVHAPGLDVEEQRSGYAVVTSADYLAAVVTGAGTSPQALPPLLANATSVYVYGFRDNERSRSLLRFLAGDAQATIRPLPAVQTVMTISGDFPSMCGPMSGLQVPVTLRADGCVCDVAPGDRSVQSIVEAAGAQLFFRVACAGVDFYVNSWESTLDISSFSTRYFDVKEFFCEAVPPVFYLKWAFRHAFSQAQTNACLIVDDPPLKRRYGFLNFREALDLMDRHNFTTTIAFIPWNWRRSHPQTLSLFRGHPERFSLAVHGCDHTSGEFAVRSPELLNRKIRTSKQRMARFQQEALIEVEHVMVFPQGEFSPETGRALKINGFVAAVNTEVAPARQIANQTRISDLWNVAIMSYGTFPIFTRRYASQGIENFAFDGLLGKPCLIASHHDVFRDHGRNLVDLVARLNALNWNLVWRPLGEVVRRSFKIRRPDLGARVVEMFASSLELEDVPAGKPGMLLVKEEGDLDRVRSVYVNENPVEFGAEAGYLRVPLTSPAGGAVRVRVAYRDDSGDAWERESARTRIKVAAKRYLSEFRDDYLSRSDFLYQSATRLKHLFS
jgi:hypothetical protein